jgi:hypothetical protein
MIVWSHKNVTNSILDLQTMLKMQQSNGFIPEEIFWSHRTPKEDLELLSQYSNTKYSDITQMPVLPYSLRAIVDKVKEENGIAKAKLITKEFLYPLVNYFKWWRNTRDLGDGLVVIIHNWESGLDASPAYDPAFHTYITALNESALNSLYPKFVELAETYRFLYGWNVTEILARSKKPDYLPDVIDTWFMVKDIGLNSVYASGWRVLSELALFVDDAETASYCETESTKSSQAILSKMYSTEQGHFQSLYIDNDGVEKFSQANTIQNIFPLLLKDLSSEHLDLLLGQLKDPNKFGGNLYALPTGIFLLNLFTHLLTYSLIVAIDDPQFWPNFEVDLMWRGTIWGFTNWFVLEGLSIHGQTELQTTIMDKWIALVQKSGINEFYQPFDGTPLGVEGVGMSTLIVDWLYRMKYV